MIPAALVEAGPVLCTNSTTTSNSDDDSLSVITAGVSDDAFTLGSNEDSDDDVEDVTPRKNDGEKNEFELYSSKDGSHLDYMEGDMKEDVKSFLLPF